MTIQEFAVAIIEELEKKIGKEECVRLNEIPKNNGIMELGLCIIEKDVNVSPTIYLQQFFDSYEEGDDLADIAEYILHLHKEHKLEKSVDVNFFMDYDVARHHVVYKLINKELNEKLLQTIPHRDFMDLCMVYYYVANSDEFGQASILIHDSHMDMWKSDEEQLYKLAIENTPQLLPAQVIHMSKMLKDMVEHSENADTAIMDDVDEQFPMYVMTNESKLYGAAVMAYPYALQDFSDQIGQNLYIIPSSVHEVILVPDTQNRGQILNEMVKEVNQTAVDPKEVLSNHIYYYDRTEKLLESYK